MYFPSGLVNFLKRIEYTRGLLPEGSSIDKIIEFRDDRDKGL